jgi:hypothetical protein
VVSSRVQQGTLKDFFFFFFFLFENNYLFLLLKGC